MCRRHFSGEEINTSHKHSWMDEPHEKDSQYNPFSRKRNLTPQTLMYMKNRQNISADAQGSYMLEFPTGWEHN